MTPGCNRKVRLEIFIHPWLPVYNYNDSQLYMTTYQIGLCSQMTKWTKRRVSWEWLIIFYPICSSLEFSLRRNGQSFQKIWTVFSLRRYGQSQNEKTPLIIITNENTRASCQNISFRPNFFIIILQGIIVLWNEIFFNVTWLC